MKRWVISFAVAVAGLAAVPDTGEACFRRRCQPAPCPCPATYSVCPPAAVVPVPPVPSGRKYRFVDASDQGEFHEDVAADVRAALPDPNESFGGTDRRLPKTTIVDAPVEDFPSVGALVKQILANNPDKEMKASSGITKSTSTRVEAEKRNVRVPGFIYAFKKEDDNDYHVILGDAPGAQSVFLNVEVSGLPVGGTAANRTRLTTARNLFKQKMGVGPTGPKGYQKSVDDNGQLSPIPVRITGSLFWDVDHPPGAVGPAEFKPKTAWEIHPVSEIEFLDQ
jgi:hypothetical protein